MLLISSMITTVLPTPAPPKAPATPVEVTREIVDHHGFADRITCLPGDYHSAAFGSGYDAALLSGMMHRETPEGCQHLLRKAFAATPEARERRLKPTAFSFNSAAGACPVCDGLGEIVVDDVGGVVLVHRDLLEDDPALLLDVLRPDERIGDHIAHDVDGQRQVDVEHPRVVAGVLLGREGVQVAAHGLDRCGDVQRRARARALEEQVLEKMRDARLAVAFMTRAHEIGDVDRDGGTGRAADAVADGVTNGRRAREVRGRHKKDVRAGDHRRAVGRADAGCA